jgi:branched-chain amino acid transport system permease protein
MNAVLEKLGVTGPARGALPDDRAVSVGLDRRRLMRGLGAAVVVLVVGLQLPSVITSHYYQGIAVSGAILGIMALGIGFLARRSGLVSLGQTAFYGGSAYLVAIASTHWGWSPLQAAVFGFVGGTVLAAVIGALVVRTPGMSFVMLTLAFGQALYQLVILDSVRSTTGGFDGLSITFKPSQTFLGLTQSDLGTPSKFWPLVWTSVVIVAVVLWLVGRSRLGTLLEGIRENEERARFSGYNTYTPRLVAFTIAGAAASLAGALFALNGAYVSPDVLSFTTAGNALIATIVGGAATLVGPVVGATLYIYAQAKFASGGNLQLYTGLALIIVLVFIPGGIVGGAGRLAGNARGRLPGGIVGGAARLAGNARMRLGGNRR